MSRRGETGFYPKSNGGGQLASNNSCDTDSTPKNFKHTSLLSDRWTPSKLARVLLGYIDEPSRMLNTFVAKLSRLLPKKVDRNT